MPTTAQARHWLDRWDRQQELYMSDREERFAVIADVVAAAVGRSDPLIVDLGAGPGSLAVRLLDGLPDATVVAVDADPVLLGLARAAYGDRPNLRIVEHDLRTPGWAAALQLPRPADALVSTTALHWLTGAQLADVYREGAGLLAPGGILVNGDHLAEPAAQPRLDTLAQTVAAGITARAGGPAGQAAGSDEVEDWAAWWAAVNDAPELADLRDARGARPLDHSVPEVPGIAEHADLLRRNGFGEVGTVWQHGDDRVLVALR